jgi:hypothetical protein
MVVAPYEYMIPAFNAILFIYMAEKIGGYFIIHKEYHHAYLRLCKGR